MSWREHLLTDRIAVRSQAIAGTDLIAEVIVDAQGTLTRIKDFLWAALGMFLGATVYSVLAVFFFDAVMGHRKPQNDRVPLR